MNKIYGRIFCRLLIDEIDEYDRKREQLDGANDSVKIKDYKKTSMNKSVSIFLQFVKPMEQEWREKKLQKNGNFFL